MRALLRPSVDEFLLGLSFRRRQVTVKLVQSPLHVIRLIGLTGRPLSFTRHGNFVIVISDEQDKVNGKCFIIRSLVHVS